VCPDEMIACFYFPRKGKGWRLVSEKTSKERKKKKKKKKKNSLIVVSESHSLGGDRNPNKEK